MNKYSPLLFVMIFSFLFGDANVQIRLQNGQKANGEFVGTYMNHVHILVEEKIIYYACDDIISITYFSEGLSSGRGFNYDCSKNTVTADILFPPELDPMTGEMTQMLPDVFNPDIPKPAVEKATSVVQKPDTKVEAGSLSTQEDFVVIDGVKYARELIKDQNDTAEIGIWNKKIPPSLYLEKLSKDKERQSRYISCGLGYLGVGMGILFLQTTTGVDGNPSDYSGIGYVIGTTCIAGGLYVASRHFRNSTMTDAGKQFENVKNIQNKNEKEKLAYESLVALASTSRIKKNDKDTKLQRNRSRRSRNSSPKEDLVFILLTALVSTAIEENKKNKPEQNIQIPLTIEEKALDNYLNQRAVPVNIYGW